MRKNARLLQIKLGNVLGLMSSLAIVLVLIAGPVPSVESTVRAPENALPAIDKTIGPRIQLESVFLENALMGIVTVRDKDLTAGLGEVHIVDAAGARVDTVFLDQVGPNQHRFRVPFSRLQPQGYVELCFDQCQAPGRRGEIYRVDLEERRVDEAVLPPEVETDPGTSPMATGGPDYFGYTWTDTARYDWEDTSAGTVVSLRDDEWAGPFSIGFSFQFYDQVYSEFYIDSNGYIGFDRTQPGSDFSEEPIPSIDWPNNFAAPFWDDLNPSAGGVVRYQTLGSAPNRRLVVEWNQVPRYSDSTRQTFQVILYQTSHNIKFQYAPTREGDYGDLSSATVGIENAEGTIGLQYPFTIPIYLARAVQFNYGQMPYNVVTSPDQQGSPAGAGWDATYEIQIKNIGRNSDSYTLSRTDYMGANWPVRFYQANGRTRLSDGNTGDIRSGEIKTFVAKVMVPEDAVMGTWTRATVRATSRGDRSRYDTVSLDAAVASSFFQVYTDDFSDDGTFDAENYIEAISNGYPCRTRLTTDQDDTAYATVASLPDGQSAVAGWNNSYQNESGVFVSDIRFAVVDRYCEITQSVTRLTDNANAAESIVEYSPVAAVEPNRNVVIAWNRMEEGGDIRNTWYAIARPDGRLIQAPTALTHNTDPNVINFPPTVAAFDNGRFLVAWERYDGSAVDIYYAVLGRDGSVIVPPWPLTNGPWHVLPRVTSMPNGQAAVVWTAENQYGYDELLYATIDANGKVTGGPAMVTGNGGSGQESSYADITGLSNGKLGVAWSQRDGSNYQIQYAIVSGTPPQPGIIGLVTYQGMRVPGVYVALSFDNGSEWSTIQVTQSGEDGVYRFIDVPPLGSGQQYQVEYLNNEFGNPNVREYLAAWIGPLITEFGPYETIAGGNIELQDIVLSSPSNGATVVPPVAFRWLRRALDSDSYVWMMIDPGSGSFWYTNLLGYVSQFTLYGLPSGASYGTNYAWFLNTVLPNGAAGVSHYLRYVAFSPSAAQGDPQGAEQEPLEMTAHPELVDLWIQEINASAPDPAPQVAPQAHTIYSVPNRLGTMNRYVSLTHDAQDRLIMSWLDFTYYPSRYPFIFYAMANRQGTALTPAVILRRTQNSQLGLSWNGHGNDWLDPLPGPRSQYSVFLSVSMKSAVPTITPIPEQVIANRGFEQGSLAEWDVGTTSSSHRPRVVTSKKHSGQYSVVLGQENAPCQGATGPGAEAWIAQSFRVPSDSPAVTLSLWYRVVTYDLFSPVDPTKYDHFAISIDGTMIKAFGDPDRPYGCDALNDMGWRRYDIDLTPYKGKVIRLKLANVNQTDASLPTWTYVDDLRVYH